MHKLSLLLVALFLGSIATVSAQKGFEINASFSPTASFLLNKEDMDNSSLEYKGTFGYNGGATLGYNFSDHFGIAVGGFYVASNQTMNHKDALLISETTTNLEYVRVPVFLKFSGDPYATFTPYVRLGPHVDLLLNANQTIKFKDGSKETIDLNNYNSLTQTYDLYQKDPVWGGTLELGGYFNLSDFVKLNLAFHVSSSFTNIETSDAKYIFTSTGPLLSPERSNSFNAMVGGTVGLSFIIGGY